MRSRFNTVKEYFSRIGKAAKTNMEYVRKATETLLPSEDGKWREQVFVTPALDGEKWDELNHGNAAYAWATDGNRVHCTIVPVNEIDGKVRSYDSNAPDTPNFGRILAKPDPGKGGRMVVLNARYLREAIHPDADEVAIYVSFPAGDTEQLPVSQEDYNHTAIQVASRRNDAQIAWAAIMPRLFYQNFRPEPHIYVPQLLTVDEVRERCEQQQAEAEQRLAVAEEEAETGLGQAVFAAA